MIPLMKTHHIILIHGLAGSIRDFSQMLPALMTQLNHLDSHTKYLVHSWNYPTADNDLGPLDFADQLQSFLSSIPSAKARDPFSLIMHSQGGIIGLLWLMNSWNGKYPQKRHKKLDCFITLAVPFWGAKIAEFTSSLKKHWEKIGLSILPTAGKKQLQELSFGSDTIFNLRNFLIQYPQFSRYVDKQFRFLNIAGKASIMQIFSPFASGARQYEDDSAVPVLSSRCGFYYIRSIKPNYSSHDRVNITELKKIELGKYFLVNALHLSPKPKLLAGITQATNECIFNVQGEHPSFYLIRDFILKRPIEEKSPHHLTSFLVDINLRLPQCSEPEPEITFSQQNGDPLNKKEITISHFLELYSKGAHRSNSSPSHQRFYFTGHLEQGQHHYSLLVQIHAPTLKPRLVEISVTVGYSTFIDLNLEQKILSHLDN